MNLLYKKNDVVEGIVTNVTSYGAFVLIDTHTSGLIHISEVTSGFVNDIHQFLSTGQRVYCRVLSVDEDRNQLKLSLKHVSKKTSPRTQRRERVLMNKKSLVPSSTIGFKSLKEKMPEWIKEKQNVEA
ncbi:MAG: S1 RNA-binding domain-containing protein [Erysipelothrix sp.]|nr:S1 RNA-binding domain-containing protein [Erysipelothrix sp.]